MVRKRVIRVLSFTMLIIVLASCTTQYTTKTKRSASEQLVLSTSVDKALEHLDPKELKGKKVYLDIGNFESQEDKGYIISSFKRALIIAGAKLVTKEDDAEYTFSISCGTYANDYDELLLGIPPLPIPIPFTGMIFGTPEMAAFKKASLRGVVKLQALAKDNKTDELVFASKPLSATSYYNKWVIGLLFSFKTTDVDEYNKYSILKGDINRQIYDC